MRATVALALLAAACGGGHAAAQAAQQRAPHTALPSARAQASASALAARRSAIVDAASKVAPAVVSVNVVGHQRETPQSPFDFFFVPRGERQVQVMGSGFIIASDGVVITNQHVVENADQIVVTTREGKDYPARLLGDDPLTDIAVLKIDGTGLPTVTLGKSTDLMIGEAVVAIGNPYGYLLGNTDPSVSAGVVSAVGRNLIPSGEYPGVYVGMIQTDAAINPGNSGGPLANALGEVVGVNSFILSSSGGSVGLGFAIPIERALRVAHELEVHHVVRRAWTGLDVAGTEGLSDWKKTGGLKITAVATGSPAARAGVEPDDIMLRASGHGIHTFLDWEAVKLDMSPGDTVPVTVRRGGANRTLDLVVEDLPTTRAEKVAVLGDVRLVTVDQAVRLERGIKSQRGALIYAIGDATQRSTGLQPGDVIVQINRDPVASAADATRAIQANAGRAPIRVFFERGGQIGYTDFYVR